MDIAEYTRILPTGIIARDEVEICSLVLVFKSVAALFNTIRLSLPRPKVLFTTQMSLCIRLSFFSSSVSSVELASNLQGTVLYWL